MSVVTTCMFAMLLQGCLETRSWVNDFDNRFHAIKYEYFFLFIDVIIYRRRLFIGYR